MARLPYADLNTPDIRPLVEQIIAERGSVLHLYQMLLHSHPIARGWLSHLTGIRQHSSLPGDIREMVIMRVAYLNRAPYEADQHAPIALREGLQQSQLDALQLRPDSPDAAKDTALFSDAQRAVIAYTDAMTLHVQVDDAVFAAVRVYFDEKQTVELTATIATYNMVSRFLEALQIHSGDQRHHTGS